MTSTQCIDDLYTLYRWPLHNPCVISLCHCAICVHIYDHEKQQCQKGYSTWEHNVIMDYCTVKEITFNQFKGFLFILNNQNSLFFKNSSKISALKWLKITKKPIQVVKTDQMTCSYRTPILDPDMIHFSRESLRT